MIFFTIIKVLNVSLSLFQVRCAKIKLLSDMLVTRAFVTIPGFEAELVNLVPTNDARFVLGHLFTSCY